MFQWNWRICFFGGLILSSYRFLVPGRDVWWSWSAPCAAAAAVHDDGVGDAAAAGSGYPAWFAFVRCLFRVRLCWGACDADAVRQDAYWIMDSCCCCCCCSSARMIGIDNEAHDEHDEHCTRPAHVSNWAVGRQSPVSSVEARQLFGSFHTLPITAPSSRIRLKNFNKHIYTHTVEASGRGCSVHFLFFFGFSVFFLLFRLLETNELCVLWRWR